MREVAAAGEFGSKRGKILVCGFALALALALFFALSFCPDFLPSVLYSFSLDPLPCVRFVVFIFIVFWMSV